MSVMAAGLAAGFGGDALADAAPAARFGDGWHASGNVAIRTGNHREKRIIVEFTGMTRGLAVGRS